MTTLTGKVSWFGGPHDTGVGPDEGLAFIYDVEMAPDLFLPYQPKGTTGLARRLNPEEYYIACRWDYNELSKEDLLNIIVSVRAIKTGKELLARPADWGPHVETDRIADISQGLMDALGIETDDDVEVTFPYETPIEEDGVFDKEVFFDYVRDYLFDGVLSQEQVTGMNFILREWRKRYDFGGDHRKLAYMLATTYHECAYRMVPITEYGSQDYLQSKPYYPYIGRGFVQLTWIENYEKGGKLVEEDLVNYPEMALEPDLAAMIMFDGMEEGWFTGKSLSDYFNESVDDPYNARRVINGTDRATEIAEYHKHFLTAIKSASS